MPVRRGWCAVVDPDAASRAEAASAAVQAAGERRVGAEALIEQNPAQIRTGFDRQGVSLVVREDGEGGHYSALYLDLFMDLL